MQFKEDNIEIIVSGNVYPEHTKKFISLLARMLNKGLENPAYQLHVFSLLCTGKSFIELVETGKPQAQEVVKTIAFLAKTLLDTIEQRGNLTNNTIDDILNGKSGSNE